MGLFSSIAKIAGIAAAPFTGGSSLLTTAISSGADLLGGYLTNNSNQGIASAQRAFQANQSGTSYQRAVKDMRAAGLNPALAYQQGGASTPQGASIPAVNSLSNAVQSGLAAKRLHEEISLLRDQRKNVQADTRQKDVNTTLAKKNVPIAELQNKVATDLVNQASSLSSGAINSAKSASKSVGNYFDRVTSDNPNRNYKKLFNKKFWKGN